MGVKYNVANVKAIQQKLYLLSDEELKAESDELFHHPVRWLNRSFKFNADQKLNLMELNGIEKKLLAFELSFALENRLPIRISYSKNNPPSIACYWHTGHLQLCFSKKRKTNRAA